MKIVFANNYFYLRGGSERVFFDEIDLLRKSGHEIVPFSRQFEKNILSEYSGHFAPALDYENARLARKIGAALSLMYSFECRKSFAGLLGNFGADVVHAHNIYGRLTTSVIDAAKKNRTPVVMTLHDHKLICPSYLMLLNGKVCEKCRGKNFFFCSLTRCHKGSLAASLVYTAESYFNSFFRKYDWISHFICPSEFVRMKHLEAGIPESKLIHIPNFIDLDNFETKFSPGNYILFVGRLSKEKGLLTLLNAVKGLDSFVKIVGDGPMRPDYERYVREGGINNVFFEGYQSGDALKSLFLDASFVVLPSEWYENAPMTILEAFAYGKPVVGSNIGGIPEMVIEGETGLLFEPGGYRELRAKIDLLLSSPALITQMGKNARKKVENEHTSEIHYEQLMNVYKKACS